MLNVTRILYLTKKITDSHIWFKEPATHTPINRKKRECGTNAIKNGRAFTFIVAQQLTALYHSILSTIIAVLVAANKVLRCLHITEQNKNYIHKK